MPPDSDQAPSGRGEAPAVAFTCDGQTVEVVVAPGESLLSVLRERLGILSVKDGCAPQGQCGCCTVLVDGAPRVACVTPVERIAGRSVTTVDGLGAGVRESLSAALLATGGSQCGFCTPGIVVRAAALLEQGRTAPADLDRALAAHLCRCTGWRTVEEAITLAGSGGAPAPPRAPGPAEQRAGLEGRVSQRVALDVPLGAGGFADDAAPRDALVAVPRPPGSVAPAVAAAGIDWVVGDSLHDARSAAGKVQGRRTTETSAPPLAPAPCPDGGVRLATSWIEPAYLEPDASWCAPGGDPASPLANGGAFGGKVDSIAPEAARELADRLGRTVRAVFSREDVARLGPKRPPIAATAVVDARGLMIEGLIVGAEPVSDAFAGTACHAYAFERGSERWHAASVPGPTTSPALRAFPFAERTVLIEGALTAAGLDRSSFVMPGRAADVLLDTCAVEPGSGAAAGARVTIDPASGAVAAVDVRIAAGDPLDEVVLRSYCVGAAHMALGWVLTEGLTVDAGSGEVLDLTIRSFGVIRAKDTPPISVTILDDPGPPLAGASDAVFAAVAAATWNAVTAAEGERPEAFPASQTRAARALRR